MKQTEMKSNVLQQLIEAMMGETSGKMKPKVMSIEIIKPKEGEEGLEDVLDKAQEEEPAEEMGEPIDLDKDGDHDEDDHKLAEEMDDEEEMCEGGPAKKRMSLKEFLSRK